MRFLKYFIGFSTETVFSNDRTSFFSTLNTTAAAFIVVAAAAVFVHQETAFLKHSPPL